MCLCVSLCVCLCVCVCVCVCVYLFVGLGVDAVTPRGEPHSVISMPNLPAAGGSHSNHPNHTHTHTHTHTLTLSLFSSLSMFHDLPLFYQTSRSHSICLAFCDIFASQLLNSVMFTYPVRTRACMCDHACVEVQEDGKGPKAPVCPLSWSGSGSMVMGL